MLHFIQMVFLPVRLPHCLSATIRHKQELWRQKTKKQRRKICDWNKTPRSFKLSSQKGSQVALNPSDNNDLSLRLAAVMCFVLQVLILHGVCTLYTPISPRHIHRSTVILCNSSCMCSRCLIYLKTIGETLLKKHSNDLNESKKTNKKKIWRIKLPPRFDTKLGSLISTFYFPFWVWVPLSLVTGVKGQ